MSKKRKNSINQEIVFFGTPKIATYALKALFNRGCVIKAVVTKPDFFDKKKRLWVFSAIKKLALALGIKNVLQPTNLHQIYDVLQKLKPFAFVVCAYGNFFNEKILKIPKFSTINIHPSLLPKYRGGAPIHWSIIKGDKETGVSLMQIIKKMDAGPVFFQKKIPIHPYDTTTSLAKKLGFLIYDVVYYELKKIFNGTYQPQNQHSLGISYAYNLTNKQEKIVLEQTAFYLCNWIKALNDKPGGYVFLKQKKIKLYKPIILSSVSPKKPGTIIDVTTKGLIIATCDFDILIQEVQIEGKKKLKVKQITNGHHPFQIGVVLT